MLLVPNEISSCYVLYDEGYGLVEHFIHLDWDHKIRQLQNNLKNQLIQISSYAMGIVSMGLGKNYYKAGEDFAALINIIWDGRT